MRSFCFVRALRRLLERLRIDEPAAPPEARLSGVLAVTQRKLSCSCDTAGRSVREQEQEFARAGDEGLCGTGVAGATAVGELGELTRCTRRRSCSDDAALRNAGCMCFAVATRTRVARSRGLSWPAEAMLRSVRSSIVLALRTHAHDTTRRRLHVGDANGSTYTASATEAVGAAVVAPPSPAPQLSLASALLSPQVGMGALADNCSGGVATGTAYAVPTACLDESCSFASGGVAIGTVYGVPTASTSHARSSLSW
jgi:hypothetical protein